MDYEKSGWGKVYLHEFNNGWNQKWKIQEVFASFHREIFCQGFQRGPVPNLCLDIQSNKTHNGAKVGVHKRNDTRAQRWKIKGKPVKIYNSASLRQVLVSGHNCTSENLDLDK